jgi:ATP-dependent Clp protease ATP-binding subunit ClpB
MVSTNFADELKRAIHIAQAIAKEYQHQSFSPAHLLKGLLHNDVGLGSTLVTWGTDINYLRDWSEYRIEKYPKSARGNEEPRGDAKVEAVLEVADVIRMKIGETNLTPLAALIAISRPDVGFPKEQLKNFPLLESDLLANAIKESGGLISSPASPSSNSTNSGASSEAGNTSAKALSKFCIDKTAAARSGKIDAIIGREKETRMMIEILGRRTKPNVVIIGEPGVGKTALVEGLTQLIVAGGVPAHLKNADLYQLDMGSLIAGASYKGEIEDRLKNIIAEIKQLTKGLLFIDEIHILLDPQGGANGLVNLLKPELARGELTVIGATTVDEYRKYMERDEAFSRRFEVLKVEEPDDTRARRMIEKVAPNFENHHNIKVSKETISEAVQLTRRYLKDRRLPDAAIDLIDRTMAAMKLMSETTQQEIDFLREELARLRSVYKEDEPVIFIEELRWFESQINDRISPVLLGQLEETQSTLDLLTPGAIADVLEALLNKLETLGLNKKEHIEKTDVAAVVAHKTGIPLGKIQANEQEKLLLLEEHLQKRVVGQDQAVEIISNAIRQNRSGVGETGKPTSFFLLGSTGTGKTELAKAVSELLFNDEKAMIRFDMSEFAEEHTVALLKGSPPGYVGYEGFDSNHLQ